MNIKSFEKYPFSILCLYTLFCLLGCPAEEWSHEDCAYGNINYFYNLSSTSSQKEQPQQTTLEYFIDKQSFSALRSDLSNHPNLKGLTEKQWLTVIKDAAERWNAESRGPALIFRGTASATAYTKHCKLASSPSVFITYDQRCYDNSCNSHIIGTARSGSPSSQECYGTGSTVTIYGKHKDGSSNYRLTADQNGGNWLLPLLIHELGHVLGLDHPNQNPKDSGKYKEDMLGHSIMNSYLLSGKDGAHLWPFEKSCVPQRWGKRETEVVSSFPDEMPLFSSPSPYTIHRSETYTTKGAMMGYMGHIPYRPRYSCWRDNPWPRKVLPLRHFNATPGLLTISFAKYNSIESWFECDILSYKRLLPVSVTTHKPVTADFSYLYLSQDGERKIYDDQYIEEKYYATSIKTVSGSDTGEQIFFEPNKNNLTFYSQLNINPTFTKVPEGFKGFHYFPRSKQRNEYTPGVYGRYFHRDNRTDYLREFEAPVQITAQNGKEEDLRSHVPVAATYDPNSKRLIYASVETDRASSNHGKIRIFYNPEVPTTNNNSDNKKISSLSWGKFQYVAENQPFYQNDLPRGTLFKPSFKTDLGIGMVCLDKKNLGIRGDKNCFVAWVDRGLGTGQILFTTFSINTSNNGIEWSNEVYPIPGAYSSNHVSLGLYNDQPILSYKTQDPYAHVGLRLYRGSLINSIRIWDILQVNDMPHDTHVVDPPTVAFAHHQNSSNNTTEEKIVLMWSQVELYE